MMGFGFVVARFGVFLREMQIVRALPADESNGPSMFLGTTLVALGVLVTLFAAFQFRRDLKRAAEGTPLTPRAAVPITIALVMSVLGAVTVWLFLEL
jgi:putative membrane protein